MNVSPVDESVGSVGLVGSVNSLSLPSSTNSASPVNDSTSVASTIRPKPDVVQEVKAAAVIVWNNIHLLDKIIHAFSSKDVYVQMECMHNRFYLFGTLVAGTNILCFYEIRLPHCHVKTQTQPFYAIFTAKTLIKALKSFIKATSHCDSFEMHLHNDDRNNGESLELYGYKHIGNTKTKLSYSKVTCVSTDNKCEFDSNDLLRNFGWDWEVNFPLQAAEFLNGLISLDAKENTKIVLEENQLYFECKDEMGAMSQKQFVPLNTSNSASSFHQSFAFAGMSSMQKFVSSLIQHKEGDTVEITDTIEDDEEDNKKENEKKEDKKKKRKQPEEKKRKTQSNAAAKNLLVKMDSVHPIALMYEHSDLICKLFVPAQNEES